MILSAGVTGFGALFTYLVRSYFAKIHSALKVLGREIAKLDGRMEGLATEVRTNTKETHGLLCEVKALWRFIDNANQRASDNGGENGRDRY